MKSIFFPANNVMPPQSTAKKTLATIILLFCFLSGCGFSNVIHLYDTNKAVKTDFATLLLPIEIDIVYHNGKKRKYLTPYAEVVEYRLLPGKHTIGLQYSDILNDEEGDHESISSNIVLIEFTAEVDKRYHVSFVKPKSLDDARQLLKNLELTIKTENQIVATSFQTIEDPGGEQIFTAQFDENVADLLKDNALVKESFIPTSNAKPIKHLRYWWSEATLEEKKQFRQWLKSNISD